MITFQSNLDQIIIIIIIIKIIMREQKILFKNALTNLGFYEKPNYASFIYNQFL